jgi:hypothetical protein
MAKKKQRPKSKSQRKAKEKTSNPRPKNIAARAKGTNVVKALAIPEPTGKCVYTDSFGQLQCESPVTKTYCDGKSGFFTEGGRC